MKDRVFKPRVLSNSAVLALLVVSAIIGSFVFHPVHASPYPTGTTEASGCATPSIPRENEFYMLSSQLAPNSTLPPRTNFSMNVSAIDTNAHQLWSQPFISFFPNQVFLKVMNGIIYAAAENSNTNVVAAYTANNGKKLWNIRLPADAQPQYSNAIAGMSVCNSIVYVWRIDAIYAYNAQNGSLLWQSKEPPSYAISYVEVTDSAVAFLDANEVTDNNGGIIHALDTKKGTPLWRVNVPRDQHFVGLVLTATDRAVYVSQFNQDVPLVVEALSISNGTLLWKTPVSLKPGNHLDCSDFCNVNPLFTQSLVANNIFYLSPSIDIGASGIVALNVNHGMLLWKDSTVSNFQPLQDKLYVSRANTSTTQPFALTSDLCQVDPITEKSQWCDAKFNAAAKGTIGNQTMVYIPGLDGVHALQKSNGKQMWIYKGTTSGTTSMMLIYGLSFDY